MGPAKRDLLTLLLLQVPLGCLLQIESRMRGLMKHLCQVGLFRCERGATAVEYGLILALVVLAMMAALSNVANKTVGMWNNVATEVLAH